MERTARFALTLGCIALFLVALAYLTLEDGDNDRTRGTSVRNRIDHIRALRVADQAQTLTTSTTDFPRPELKADVAPPPIFTSPGPYTWISAIVAYDPKLCI